MKFYGNLLTEKAGGRMGRVGKTRETNADGSGGISPATTAAGGKRLFTLIELLIVIAIIAILAGMLMPALVRARGAARSAHCVSNLRQIGMAMSMYMNDSGGKFPVASVYIDTDPDCWDTFEVIGWDYHEIRNPDNVVYDPGVLGPYLSDVNQIYRCPVSRDIQTEGGRPFTGYAYNADHLGTDPPATEAQVRRLSETVMIADSAYFSHDPQGTFDNNFLRAPGSSMYDWIGPNVHFRHNGAANVLYVDTGVRSAVEKFNVSPNDPLLADISADDEAYRPR